MTSISISLTVLIDKSNAAQIYTYDSDNFDATSKTYHDTTISSDNNKCLNGLINGLPQKGDKSSTQACLNTFGYNPEKKITSPVMIVFEISQKSQKLTTIVIYQSKNGQIHQERFKGVGARYSEWYAPQGIYTLDYLKPQKNPSFKPAYGNFYTALTEKDKNGNPVNIGFHGRLGNLMAGNGSNGCHRHSVTDMKRIMTIIKNAGKEAKLPFNWYEKTLPIAVISSN
ncbi:MAG: L,D-transpeptidase [Cyanobacteria bacterium P01_D01_bin.50]